VEKCECGAAGQVPPPREVLDVPAQQQRRETLEAGTAGLGMDLRDGRDCTDKEGPKNFTKTQNSINQLPASPTCPALREGGACDLRLAWRACAANGRGEGDRRQGRTRFIGSETRVCLLLVPLYLPINSRPLASPCNPQKATGSQPHKSHRRARTHARATPTHARSSVRKEEEPFRTVFASTTTIPSVGYCTLSARQGSVGLRWRHSYRRSFRHSVACPRLSMAG
jgi:hypothetical protein